MTEAEARKAMDSGERVLLDHPVYGVLPFKCIDQIIRDSDDNKSDCTKVRLIDRSGNSTTITKVEYVRAYHGF